MNELTVNPELCIDCAKCERNCPQNAIKVDKGVPLFCMNCSPDKAPCLQACPEGAIESLGGAIVINDEKCIGCGLCQDICPIGAINMDNTGTIHKCDLCINEDHKECIESCPTNALKEDSNELILEKQKKIASELNKVKNIL
jgi:anaerobic carbon-monoxide dehydrogenase iron sulfur subunit